MKNYLTSLAAAVAVALATDAPSVQAQSSTTISQSQFNSANNGIWSSAWGSDASIVFRTNNVNTGVTGGPQMIDGGASYTSDVWTMDFTFNSGNVSITANSAEVGALYWTLNSSYNLTAPLSNLLFGVSYNANNNESISVGSILVNHIPISGTATVDGSQNFAGLELDYGSAITSLQYDLTIETPTTWERQSPDGPPYGPALLDTLIIPGIEVVPEPSPLSMFILAGLGGFLSVFFRKK